MKKLFLSTFLLCGAALTLSAQTASLEVSYMAKSPSLKYGKEKKIIENRFNLLASPSESKFYSPKTQMLDSLESTPEGKKIYNQMAMAAFTSGSTESMPTRDAWVYILKNFDKNELTHYDVIGTEKYIYREPIDQISWEVTDSTKKILGYECIKASAEYHGRKWEVWFAPDIPLQNGPWKLHGLPGLIMSAATSDGIYSFTATGIQQSRKEIKPVYLADLYETIDRKNYLKKKRTFTDNPLTVAKAQLAALGIKIEVSGAPTSELKSNGIDFLETDYR